MEKKKSSRRLKSGVYTVVICAAMMLAVIGLNLVISLLPAQAMKLDTTADELYTFSQQTTQVVGGLKEDVTMYLIVEPGKEDSYIVNLLERYRQLSGHIAVRHINPLINPTFAAAYTDETVENNGVIVVSEKRSKVVQKADMYSYGFDYTYYTNATVFEGETRLTGAVSLVTGGEAGTLLVTSGHGEPELPEHIEEAAGSEGFIAKTSAIDADALKNADAVAVISPLTDITADEKNMLSEYLDGGGSLLLISGYSEKGLPNLYELMYSFGMEALPGVVIEGDGAHSISGYPFYLLPDITEHEITEPLLSSGADVLLPTAMALRETERHRGTLAVSPLLMTSEKAYRKEDPYNTQTFEQEDGDETGSFALGMAAEESFSGNNIKVVWFGSDMMADEQVDKLISGSNTDIIVNTLGWMCGRENSINVRAKSTITPYLTVTTSLKNTMTIVICAVLPAAALAAGIAIYVHRRRRK